MNQSLAAIPSVEHPTLTEVGSARFFAWCSTMIRQGGAPLLYVEYVEHNAEGHPIGPKTCLGFVGEFDAEKKVVTLLCGGSYGPYKIAAGHVRRIILVDKGRFLKVCVAHENAHGRLWRSAFDFAEQVIDTDAWVSRVGQARNLASQQ